MPALSAASISLEQLQEYVSLDEQARDLERQARAFRKRTDQLKFHFGSVLDALDRRTLTRYGYRVQLVPGPATVSWKDEFLALAGPEAAAQKTAEAMPSERLQVLPPDVPLADQARAA